MHKSSKTGNKETLINWNRIVSMFGFVLPGKVLLTTTMEKKLKFMTGHITYNNHNISIKVISLLLFLKVNPNAKFCLRFNLTSFLNFTILTIFN